MKKLVHVVRGMPERGTELHMIGPDGEGARVHRHPEVLVPRRVNTETGDLMRDGEFFLVDERDAAVVLEALAHANPGHEVRIYNCEQIAQCPAAPMVVKKIDASGVLPV